MMSAPLCMVRPSIDVVSECIRPDFAVVEDDTRGAVIDVIDASCMAWGDPMRTALAEMLVEMKLGMKEGESLRDVLARASNDQLATTLWAVWSTGGLRVTSTTRH